MSIPVVGDPHHEIRKDLQNRGWLEVFYNRDYGHLRKRGWADHPNGYFQPAVLAADKNQRILYRWRCVPKYSNMSGAGARPDARYTWDHVKAQQLLDGDAAPDTAPELGAPDLSWLHFLLIMSAHGWFIRPRAFPLLRDGGKDQVTPTDALRRAYIFLSLWVIASVVLPSGWVATALLVWVAAFIPGLVEIHRQFQNEPDAY